MQGEMKVYTYSAFRMAAVATIRASADTIRAPADRLIVFLSAISLFAITSYSPSASIFPGEKFYVESMLQRERNGRTLYVPQWLLESWTDYCEEKGKELFSAIRGKIVFLVIL